MGDGAIELAGQPTEGDSWAERDSTKMMDKSYTYHGVRRQTDRLMNDTDQVELLHEEFGSPGVGLTSREDPAGSPAARYCQTHTNRLLAFSSTGPVEQDLG